MTETEKKKKMLWDIILVYQKLTILMNEQKTYYFVFSARALSLMMMMVKGLMIKMMMKVTNVDDGDTG